MARILLLMIMSNICFAIEIDNHLRRDVSIKVPKPFIVTTSLGMNKHKNDKPNFSVNNDRNKYTDTNQDLRKIHDRRQGNDKFYNFQNDDMKKFVSSLPVDDKSPKINFYQINCAVGQKCSAIIPGPKTPVPSPRKRTDEDMRIYLKKHGLNNGFNYSDNDRVNKNNVVARYFKGEEERKRRARSWSERNMNNGRNGRNGRNGIDGREGRRIYPIFDYDSYWPGSEYRPNKVLPKVSQSQLNAKVYKFGVNSQNKPKQSQSSWTKVQSSDPYNYDDAIDELPIPSFSNFEYNNNNKNNNKNRPSPYPPSSKGAWNRFSNSMISQYDKKSNGWVEVSSSNTDLGGGYVNLNLKPISHTQSYHGTHNNHAGVGLTVLGVGEEKNPIYNETPIKTTYTYPNLTPFQSSYYPLPQDHAPPSIYSPPSNPNSVSFPLNVHDPEISKPVLVFSNEGINTNISFDYNDTNDIPFSTHDYSDYTDLTKVNNTKVAIAPIPTPKVITRVIVQQQPSPTQSQQTSGGGGGGGGGSLINNAYAVMAAVGAGLIPASIVAILPVLMGKKRRRRSLNRLWEPSSHFIPLEGEDTTDPIYKFIQDKYILHNKQNPR